VPGMRPPRAHAPGALRGGIARESRTVLFGGARRRRSVALRLVPLVALAVALLVFGVFAVVPARAHTPPPHGAERRAQPPSLVDEALARGLSTTTTIGCPHSATAGVT
jgi:hypothetical protein